MKKILFTRPDGGASIVHPAPDARLDTETEDEFVARIAISDVPADALNVQIIEQSEVPTDRAYRNAWRQSAGVISVDMPAAREIHAGRIAIAQVAEIARLKIEERKERLKGNTSLADSHAATVTALEALDLNTLATQIAAVPNPTALLAIWPADVPQ